MGLTFTNIHVRVSGALEPEALVRRLTADRGLTPVGSADEADVRVLVAKEPGSRWVTIASDLFDGDPDAAERASRELAKTEDAPVLTVGCFDSDYLYMNLLDPARKTDAWAATGRFPGGRTPHRSNYPAWKGYVADAEQFRQVMRQRYISAEDCLPEAARLLDVPEMQLSCLVEDDQACAETSVFFFRPASSAEAAEPPKFEVRIHDTMYQLGEGDACAFYINVGGASRGVAVAFGGPCLDNDKVRIARASIQTMDRRGNGVVTRVELKRITDENGRSWMYGECASLPIPESVPGNVPPAVRQDKEFQRTIVVRFSAASQPDLIKEIDTDDDMYVVLLPLADRSGQAGAVMRSPGSFAASWFDARKKRKGRV